MADESKTAPEPNALWQHVLLGTSGLRVSPLCLGTMTFGGAWGIGSTKEQAREIFLEYCKQGGNFIDTANKYHEGESESWLGEFMEEAGNRDDLVIATKYSLPMASTSSLEVAAKPSEGFFGGELKVPGNHVGNNRKNMRRAVEESLKRLRTDYIDVYYVHFYDYLTAPDEVMRTLNDLVSSGKILHAAISDAPVWYVAECNQLAKERHWAPFDCMQYKYSLLDRTIERDALHYARTHGQTVVTWDALGGGRLTGKFKRPTTSEEEGHTGDSTRSKAFGLKVSERDFDIVDVVKEVAEELDCTPARVALAWNLRQKNVLPLVGARTPEQLRDNLGALSLPITKAQLAKLDAATAVKDKGFILSFIGEDFQSNPWHAKVAVVEDF